MGQTEKNLKKKQRNEKIQGVILATVKAAGVLSVALLAPNALKMFKILKPKSRQLQTRINRSRDRLVNQGLLKWSSQGFLTITNKGEAVIQRAEAKNYRLKKPKKWDGKWRILAFDIPERKKSLRDQIRLILVDIGFIMLQHSVWVYPYDCEDFITLLKIDLRIGKSLIYIIADSIENDKPLRTHFELPPN